MPFNEPLPLITSLMVTAAKGAFTTLDQTFSTINVQLSEGEKLKYQREGQKTEPFVDRAITFANNHGTKIPSDLVVTKLTDDANSKAAMEDIMAFGTPIINKMVDILTVFGIIQVRDSNRIYAHAKIEAKTDSALKAEVDAMGARYHKSPAETSTNQIAKEGTLSLSGVTPGYRVVNSGTTIINISLSIELAGKLKETAAIRILPGDSAILPAGWTSIIITNESTTAPAECVIKK